MASSFSMRSLSFLLPLAALAVGCGVPDSNSDSATPEDELVDDTGQAITTDQIIHEARGLLGIPYKAATCSAYGGIEPMDCDQYTWTVFHRLGVNIGCWTNQMNAGTRVALSDARPGDLLFYSEDGSGNLTHVAIKSYNGYILHESSYYGKSVESLGKYVNGLFMARRVR